MQTADFDYHLPPLSIAQRPAERGRSRMLVLDRTSGELADSRIDGLPGYLRPDDLLLLNDTRVISARLEARRATGRRFEILLLRPLADDCWQALVRPAARARVGERLRLSDGGVAIPQRRLDGGRWEVRFEPVLDLARLEDIGSTPLPPYVDRPGGATDQDRIDYQTVYAASPGAVAAPTAGLHFTHEILDAVRAVGAEVATLTLHVGLGTFQPVQVSRVEEHRMHREWFHIPDATASVVNGALESGRRIVCVGTTTVRALEGALAMGAGVVQPGDGWTDLFITPGYRFHGVGVLLTNFHLPRSTLLMLVSAFAGRDQVLEAYRYAIDRGYRFYSYGDAMLII